MSSLFYRQKRIYYRLSAVPRHAQSVFGVDKGSYRFFVCFDSTEEFLEWQRGLPNNEKTINEVVLSDTRKLILDIDSPDDSELSKFQMYDFERHVGDRIREVFRALDIGEPDILFYSMCSDDKISHHVVVSNFAFTACTCTGLCMIISKDQIWDRLVDTGIYKKIQCIRLEGHTKFGEKRWKVLSESSLEIYDYRSGMISDTEGVEISKFECNILSPIKNWMSNVTYQTPNFEIRKISADGKTAFLRRTCPGYCAQCHRTHDRENAVIINYSNEVFRRFVCWRFYYTFV